MTLRVSAVFRVGCSEAALQPAVWTLLFLLPLIKRSQSLADQSVCVGVFVCESVWRTMTCFGVFLSGL